MPVATHLRSTYDEVGENQLRGFDIHDAFVEAARFRVASVTGKMSGLDAFATQDFLRNSKTVVDATHVVMNPPYIMVDRPDDASWANRRVNAAAVFVMRALETMSVGSKIIALLPEVLRSGSTYAEWRKAVQSRATSVRVLPFGRFDTSTNIDVFALYCDVAEPHEALSADLWSPAAKAPFGTVGEHFEIHVGAVVPHRTPHDAAVAPFLTSNGAQPWAVVERVDTKRAVSARLDRGPLVAVRRTSSPKERERVKAVLVLDEQPIGIENHLIVLKPRSGGADACVELMKNLRDARTSIHINEVIRCRHLTVGAVSSLPWWTEPAKG